MMAAALPLVEDILFKGRFAGEPMGWIGLGVWAVVTVSLLYAIPRAYLEALGRFRTITAGAVASAALGFAIMVPALLLLPPATALLGLLASEIATLAWSVGGVPRTARRARVGPPARPETPGPAVRPGPRRRSPLPRGPHAARTAAAARAARGPRADAATPWGVRAPIIEARVRFCGAEAALEALVAAEEIHGVQPAVDRPHDVVHHQHHAGGAALDGRIVGGDERHHGAGLDEVDRHRHDRAAAFEHEGVQQPRLGQHLHHGGQRRDPSS